MEIKNQYKEIKNCVELLRKKWENDTIICLNETGKKIKEFHLKLKKITKNREEMFLRIQDLQFVLLKKIKSNIEKS